jgi:glycosyltransferase involved in cell wall biosynthesis
MKITAAIITLNEAENIRAACESVAWTDEIIVVDSGSTDATREIAAECGARVINRPWPGFALQKQFATDESTHEWVLSLDADERVSDELRTEIQSLGKLSEAQLSDGYLFPRRSWYMGRWIRGGGWYPDRQLRLFRKTKGVWQGAHVHESLKMKAGATTASLHGALLHYPVPNVAFHHRMIGERYAPLGARQLFESGKRTSAIRIAIAAPAAFLRSLILKGGLRDGVAGWTIAGFAAHHAFLKQVMLWELQKKEDSRH